MSEDRGSSIVWGFTHNNREGESKGLKSWSFKRETELLFTEYGDRAEWGTLHFTAPSVGVPGIPVQTIEDSSEFRMSAMNLGLLHCCVSDFQGPVLFKTRSTTPTVASWTKNLSSPLRSRFI